MSKTRVTLQDLYGSGDSMKMQRVEFSQLKEFFTDRFGGESVHFFSSPGRTELCGNHTDHNGGIILAASINLDKIAVAAREIGSGNSMRVRVLTQGFHEEVDIDLSGPDGTEYRREEEGSSAALVRGIAHSFISRGYRIGGFDCVIRSRVALGSGLSSSASLEVLIGKIFSHLFNEDRISPLELAIIGQEAENRFFGKPCGLMDQLACAVGGIIKVDFRNPEEPQVETVPGDFSSRGYGLMIIHTGGSHADLTDDYGAIPREMGRVANFFGASRCRDIGEEAVLSSLQELREKAGDRAVLRALHFFRENRRVEAAAGKLGREELTDYLAVIAESGNSSRSLLQNVFSSRFPDEQGMNVALALTERWFKGGFGAPRRGVSRVHGGGFAGTIQAYIPEEEMDEFTSFMEGFLGPGSVVPLAIRPYGPVEVEVDIQEIALSGLP